MPNRPVFQSCTFFQVAKGRDTGVSQVTGFTAKISMGNGMQVSTASEPAVTQSTSHARRAGRLPCINREFRCVLVSVLRLCSEFTRARVASILSPSPLSRPAVNRCCNVDVETWECHRSLVACLFFTQRRTFLSRAPLPCRRPTVPFSRGEPTGLPVRHVPAAVVLL